MIAPLCFIVLINSLAPSLILTLVFKLSKISKGVPLSMDTLSNSAFLKSILPSIAFLVIRTISFSFPINLASSSRLSSFIIVLSISAKSNFFLLIFWESIRLISNLCCFFSLFINFDNWSDNSPGDKKHSYALFILNSLKLISALQIFFISSEIKRIKFELITLSEVFDINIKLIKF